MSIRTYFENIADAIKDKNPNIANVTPVEMPSAIRSIPSGSSTAGGVTYDNTASGLTANNVQDAIDELAEDVSTINSDLSELKAYRTIAAAPANTTYGSQISVLKTAYDALSDEDKKKCVIIRATSIYHMYVNGETPLFARFLPSLTDITIDGINFANSKYFGWVIRTTGNSYVDNTSLTDTLELKLCIIGC